MFVSNAGLTDERRRNIALYYATDSLMKLTGVLFGLLALFALIFTRRLTTP